MSNEKDKDLDDFLLEEEEDDLILGVDLEDDLTLGIDVEDDLTLGVEVEDDFDLSFLDDIAPVDHGDMLDATVQLGVSEDLTEEEILAQEAEIGKLADQLEEANFIRLEEPLFRSGLDEFLDDEDNLDDLDMMVGSQGLALGFEVTQQMLLSDTVIKEQQLQLGMTNETYEAELEKPKYEVAISPKEYVLSVYVPKEEDADYIHNTNEDIHNHLSGVNKKMPEAIERLNAHLDLPAYDFLPKYTRLLSPKYKTFSTIRKWLVRKVRQHHNNPTLHTIEHTQEDILDLWEQEQWKELNPTAQLKLRELVRGFFQFGTSILDETSREIEVLQYKRRDVETNYPEKVTNTKYICKCDSELEMQEGRPTLCMFIQKDGKNVHYTLINEPVYCVKCGVDLVLPLPLAQFIEGKMIDYIRKIPATIDGQLVYRPPVEVLKTFIPSDAVEYFDLDIAKNIKVQTSSPTNKLQNTALTAYKRLINYWMESVEAQHKAEELQERVNLTTETSKLVDLASHIEPTGVVDLDSYRFTRTLLHYLEGYGLFNVTEKKLAFAKVVKAEGINQQSFDDEYALKWLWKYAPLLASLNNLFEDLTIKPLDIREEYIEVITHIVTLRHLAKPQNLLGDKLVGSWFKKPHGDNQGKLNKLIKGSPKAHSYLELPGSAREMQDSKAFYDPKTVWMDYYHFMRVIMEPLRFNPSTPPELSQRIGQIKRMSFQAFTGLEKDLLDYLVPPTTHFEEFKQVFMEYGHRLFYGVFVDEKVKNIAKALTIVYLSDHSRLESMLKVNSKPVVDPSGLVPLATDFGGMDPDRYRAKLVLDVAIDLAVLPEPYHSIREEEGSEALSSESMLIDSEHLVNDEDFYNRYKEVIPCILQQNTTNL